MSGMTLVGCCLPDDRCGVSTHINRVTLNGFASGPDAEFSQPECLSAVDFNDRLERTELAAMAVLPDAEQRCDYAALSRRLGRTARAGRAGRLDAGR